MTDHSRLFDEFVADGNTLVGPRPSHTGSFNLTWVGSDNHLQFGDGVTLTNTRIKFLGRGGTISVGSETTVKGDLVVNKGSKLTLGEKTYINRACDIRAQEGANINIGNGCLFADVTIMTSDLHSIMDLKSGKRSNPAQSIVIEDDVWLAENVKIAKGARVGAGAIIAAGSIVTGAISPFCIGAGRPAKVIKSGVTWDRRIFAEKPIPARTFKGSDIPFDKEVLRRLVASRKLALTIDAIEHELIKIGDAEKLPGFAKWYLVYCRSYLGQSQPEDAGLLKLLLEELPNHKGAQKLYDERFSDKA